LALILTEPRDRAAPLYTALIKLKLISGSTPARRSLPYLFSTKYASEVSLMPCGLIPTQKTSIALIIAGKWSKKWFRSCDRNSDFFRDLILMEVSELNGMVWFIVELNGIVWCIDFSTRNLLNADAVNLPLL
jgi:hypothetical protein